MRRVFLCRCEDVTIAELEHAVGLGLQTVEDLKRYTGLGTGPCQGKECLAGLTAWLIGQGILPADEARPFTPRPPVEPVSLGLLAAFPAPPPPAGDPEEDP